MLRTETRERSQAGSTQSLTLIFPGLERQRGKGCHDWVCALIEWTAGAQAGHHRRTGQPQRPPHLARAPGAVSRKWAMCGVALQEPRCAGQ